MHSVFHVSVFSSQRRDQRSVFCFYSIFWCSASKESLHLSGIPQEMLWGLPVRCSSLSLSLLNLLDSASRGGVKMILALSKQIFEKFWLLCATAADTWIGLLRFLERLPTMDVLSCEGCRVVVRDIIPNPLHTVLRVNLRNLSSIFVTTVLEFTCMNNFGNF